MTRITNPINDAARDTHTNAHIFTKPPTWPTIRTSYFKRGKVEKSNTMATLCWMRRFESDLTAIIKQFVQRREHGTTYDGHSICSRVAKQGKSGGSRRSAWMYEISAGQCQTACRWMPILRSLASIHILFLPAACLLPTGDSRTIQRCIYADGFGSAAATRACLRCISIWLHRGSGNTATIHLRINRKMENNKPQCECVWLVVGACALEQVSGQEDKCASVWKARIFAKDHL